jgi:hypothetical protein
MKKECRIDDESCQSFPISRPIRLDCGLAELRRQVAGLGGDCYAYIVGTVKMNASGEFSQEGSGPNWQGGRITLCTCKHYMRTFKGAPEAWKDCWIAGFTSRSHDGCHWLVYLVQVERAFASHAEPWDKGGLPQRALAAKRASEHQLGDLFEPKSDARKDVFSWRSYRAPVSGHSHSKTHPDQWHDDIDYNKGVAGRRPALLAGNPERSFLWSNTIVRYRGKLPRGQKRLELAALIETQLEEEPS